MPNLQSVGLTNGAATSGTGNVSTIDSLFGYNYTNMSTNTTSTIKGSPGFLHCITINQTGVGTIGGTGGGSTATIYDSLSGSGTVIATLDTVSTIGALLYDIAFTTGLTIVTTAAGNAPNLTISWR